MPYSLATRNKTRKFIDTYGDGIIKAIKGTNLYFATIVAQKCLESGYGESGLAKEANNFGGIKYAPKLAGVVGFVTRDTAEYINGKLVRIPQNFSKFKDVESGMRATIQVLLKDRYKAARDTAKSAKEQVLMIARAGYTTTPPELYLKNLSGILEATQDYVQIGRVN